ncbi:hypothetical protein F4V43_01640 [Paenibacillus spiritus]|uniref:Uncharacterized protein n=1 Tax=Paenibacillus spiritus TaxID=2496557 RepID=A0A5J5GGE6_9BACL|nr:hypothetical protein [Paenibacillus spiritus]KAA9007215.1 hypothetical protein F4V43_01640 [Paenibacillus spiritus]
MVQAIQGKKKIGRIKIDPNIKLCEPSPQIVETVIGNSKSNIFDEAKDEWKFQYVLFEDAEGFSGICDLCGNVHLKYCFVIYNPYTEKTLNVGSHCIIRFKLLKGNVDAETGTIMVNNFLKLQKHISIVQGLIKEMMNECVDARSYQLFIESLERILQYHNIKDPTIDQLGEICFGDRWEGQKRYLYKRDRLHKLWYERASIKMIRAKGIKFKALTEKDIYWGKNRTGNHVHLTLAGRSSAFKTDHIADE